MGGGVGEWKGGGGGGRCTTKKKLIACLEPTALSLNQRVYFTNLLAVPSQGENEHKLRA